MAKGGLGRGLNFLVDSASAEIGSSQDYVDMPIDKISPNPNQPRRDFSEDRIEELVASIKKDGLLQPILVRPEGDDYQIVAGERRWQACKRLGMQIIPAKLIIASEVEAQQIALVENLQRDNLNAIEEARGYQRLIDLSGCMQKEIAEAVSKKPTTISNALRLLDLPEEVQDMMFDGLLTSGHGRAILSIPDDEAKIRLAKKVVDEHLSVRETENLARLYGTQGLERTKRPSSPRSFKFVARKLRQLLDTNVKVKSVRGKNRIEIEFKDEDDLERIFEAIGSSKKSSKPVLGFVGVTEEPAITYSRDLDNHKVSIIVDEDPEEVYAEEEISLELNSVEARETSNDTIETTQDNNETFEPNQIEAETREPTDEYIEPEHEPEETVEFKQETETDKVEAATETPLEGAVEVVVDELVIEDDPIIVITTKDKAREPEVEEQIFESLTERNSWEQDSKEDIFESDDFATSEGDFEIDEIPTGTAAIDTTNEFQNTGNEVAQEIALESDEHTYVTSKRSYSLNDFLFTNNFKPKEDALDQEGKPDQDLGLEIDDDDDDDDDWYN